MSSIKACYLFRFIDFMCIVYTYPQTVVPVIYTNTSQSYCKIRLVIKPQKIFHITSDNVWTVLTGQPTDQTSSIVLHDVKEIETWILRLLSAPVPIPGSTRIEVEVLSPTVHEPLLFALPDHTRFSLVDFPLHLPLELLGMLWGMLVTFYKDLLTHFLFRRC